MGSFGKCGGGGRRLAPRQAAPLIAVVSTLSTSHAATVVDISTTGVRLRGDDLPGIGAELILGIENIRTFGCVAWRRGGECGIAFDDPLPPCDVELVRRKAAASRGLSPEMRAAYDDWTLGLAR